MSDEQSAAQARLFTETEVVQLMARSFAKGKGLTWQKLSLDERGELRRAARQEIRRTERQTQRQEMNPSAGASPAPAKATGKSSAKKRTAGSGPSPV
jgi:hypothetical protein